VSLYQIQRAGGGSDSHSSAFGGVHHDKERINDLPKDARLTDSQRSGILAEIGRKAELARHWGTLPLVEMTNDRTISLTEERKRRCYFGSPGSALADRAIEKGLCVVSWHSQALLEVLSALTARQVRDVREAPEVCAIADETCRIVQPQARGQECLDLLRQHFDLGRVYKVGINPQAAPTELRLRWLPREGHTPLARGCAR